MYMIFSYFQENQLLASKLQQLHLKYTRAKTQRKTFETKYETSHSNEEMFQTSNRQLKLNLATTNKQLAETVAQLNHIKVKFTDAHLFYKEMEDILDIPDDDVNGLKEKKVDPAIAKLMKYKLAQWKSGMQSLDGLKRNYSKLLEGHRLLNTTHSNVLQKLVKLEENNAQMVEEKVKNNFLSPPKASRNSHFHFVWILF